jgi:replicative DNA helicase
MAKFKTINEAIVEVESYIKNRMEGTITSMKTGFPKLDKCMIDGIEWSSTLTIGGRPSVGKSAFSDCIIDGAFKSNVGDDGLPTFDLLDFNWELSSKVILLRRLSAEMKESYKHIISADGTKISPVELNMIQQILKNKYGRLPITFSEEPLTTKEFADTVKRFVDKVKRNVLVRIDHTLLARQAASETSQVQMLLNLLMEANSIKKEYPVIFMFLTQVNREFEERQEDGSDRAFPRQSDVYGGDAAAMFSETILLLNKPSKYGVSLYGRRNTDSCIHVDTNDLFAHIVKNRNSEGDFILHYKENFKHMSIKEY